MVKKKKKKPIIAITEAENNCNGTSYNIFFKMYFYYWKYYIIFPLFFPFDPAPTPAPFYVSSLRSGGIF